MSVEPDTSPLELEAAADELERRGEAILAGQVRRAAGRAAQALAGARDDLRRVDARLDELLQVVTSMTAMDFGRKVEVVEDDDWFIQALAIGLNIMGDELKRATEELTETRDRALAASRAKSAFLANMSHELRTPLNAIIGYSELLRDECEDRLEPEQLRDIDKIVLAARHLLALIKDTLDLSKIEAGKMEVVAERFAVDDLVDDVTATLLPLVHGRGNRLLVERAPGLGAMWSDRTKIAQSLYNLLGNANKFTTLGTIRFAARALQVRGQAWVEFVVEDTGIGIPRDKLGSVFGAFNQVDDATTRRFGGTGLGLAITRHFCEMLGGEIRARSELGHGSTFVISLPAELPATRGAEAPAAARAESLLVASPDPLVAELARFALDGTRVAVVSATSGAEAQRLAAALRPTAILLDDGLREPDAWASLLALKGDPELSSVPVFVAARGEERAKGVALGALDVLRKPLRRESLQPLVARFGRPGDLGRVLVVAGAELRRELPRRLFEARGWQPLEAASAAVAGEALGCGEVRAVVLDLGLPVAELDAVLQSARRLPVVCVAGPHVDAAALAAAQGRGLVVPPGVRVLEALAQHVHAALAVGG